MVWINGGIALDEGHIDFDVYDPQVFVEKGDVVFVTVQYRTGVFGFFNYKGGSRPDAPSNVGFKDQVIPFRFDNVNLIS